MFQEVSKNAFESSIRFYRNRLKSRSATIEDLYSAHESDFNDVSERLQRKPNNCKYHWNKDILPILKNNILGLPQGIEWMRRFLEYIVENKIKRIEDINYVVLVRENFHGQTTASIKLFAVNIMRITKNKKTVILSEPMHEICQTRLDNPSKQSFLGSKKRANLQLEYSEWILKIYNSLIV